MNELDNKIKAITLEVGGNWGCYVKNLASDEVVYRLNPTKHFANASVGKLPIALYVFSEVDKGNTSFDDKLILSEDLVLGGLKFYNIYIWALN